MGHWAIPTRIHHQPLRAGLRTSRALAASTLRLKRTVLQTFKESCRRRAVPRRRAIDVSCNGETPMRYNRPRHHPNRSSCPACGVAHGQSASARQQMVVSNARQQELRRGMLRSTVEGRVSETPGYMKAQTHLGDGEIVAQTFSSSGLEGHVASPALADQRRRHERSAAETSRTRLAPKPAPAV